MTSKLSFDDIRAANANAHLKEQVGVFVGGTSGIGLNTALAFARHTESPTVYIVGRNAEAGERIIRQMREINSSPNAKYHFLKHDFTLVSEADALADTILNNEKKINLLLMAPGYLTLDGRKETKEGIDAKFAVNYYARWRAITKMLPLLDAAGNSGEPARVVSVLSAGDEAKVDVDDLDLKKTYSLMKVNKHFVTFTSLMTERFAALHPNVSFIHGHPGIVKTNILRELPFYVRALGPAFNFIATRPEDSGERFYYAGAVSPDFQKGAHIVGPKLNDVSHKGRSKGFLSTDLQELVWQHTTEMFTKALGQ